MKFEPHKGMNMNNMSLIKISMVVITATFTTLLVSAYDDISSTKQLKENMNKQIKFSQLADKFDIDKDGLLSKNELKATNNDALYIAFNRLDTNKDTNISEQEFLAFIENK